MKKRRWMVAGLLMLSAVLWTGCGEKTTKGKDNTEKQEIQEEEQQVQENSEETALRTVFLKSESGGELFVTLENEIPFFGTIPEEIYDENNEKITKGDLNSGDVLLVYGNQIMTNSYPGQYPGISKLVREEKENQQYVEKYGELLKQFCPEPDKTQVPALSVEYRQPEAIVSAAVTQGGYQWTKELENGQKETEMADAVHVLEMGENLADFTLKEETDFTLLFSYEPQSVTVECWPEGEIRESGSEGKIPEGEAVEVLEGEAGFAFHGKPGYVYHITGVWEEGTVSYGFLG
ncbi:MAG: hypothetical protein KH828_00800 [Clostridiales bacterium]|nr:hypothetical protein [Clostridiales bacterium]